MSNVIAGKKRVNVFHWVQASVWWNSNSVHSTLKRCPSDWFSIFLCIQIEIRRTLQQRIFLYPTARRSRMKQRGRQWEYQSLRAYRCPLSVSQPALEVISPQSESGEWEVRVTKPARLQMLQQVFYLTSSGILVLVFFLCLELREDKRWQTGGNTTRKPGLQSIYHHYLFIVHSFMCLWDFFFSLSFASLTHILGTLPKWIALLGYNRLIPSWKPSWFPKWNNFVLEFPNLPSIFFEKVVCTNI